MPQFQGHIFRKNWDLSNISCPNLNKKNATLINALIGSIFRNKNISCLGTFKSAEISQRFTAKPTWATSPAYINCRMAVRWAKVTSFRMMIGCMDGFCSSRFLK